MLGSGLFSAAVAVAIKWVVIGHYRAGRHPLWSLFVWRDELVNSAHEQLAGEWLLRFALGTPLMSLYLRAMGSKVGRGVWCETTAITEYDMVELGDGSAVNRGACLMTHVFHDRLLRVGPASIGAGATMGPTSAVLPDTRLGANTCIGGHSVVLSGERLPAAGRWRGAPVTVWEEAVGVREEEAEGGSARADTVVAGEPAVGLGEEEGCAGADAVVAREPASGRGLSLSPA